MGHGHCQECGRRVRGQHPLLISKAFEVGTVHFGPRLLAFAAFQKMICGVSYDKIRLGFEQMLGFPVARSTLCRRLVKILERPAGQQFAPFQRPPTALGPVANTDTKLLIYGLFQKGRVLAQDGVESPAMGKVRAIPKVGGLHHYYTRHAAA